ncbi:MAG TPA: IPT/TIG domain-containing protein [Steroidobacter sp.]|uniref:IPT/TIG domain-containing protein n=1 Tax=Steroidobacter sp. TaxID=1978227 RepID=UPI002EDA1DA2
MQFHLPGARRVAGYLLLGLLAGCGGSGGDEAARTEISTDTISFSAPGPNAVAPAAQEFTVTFGEDVAHLAVVHNGDAIASATSVLNGRTARISVVPAAPSSIGPGPFAGTVAVTGYTCADPTCSRMSAGSTAQVRVSYQISPAVQVVAPYVETAGVSDDVLIRGLGFRSFLVNAVRFGDTPATEITVNSTGTEILATHPALPAGRYTVYIEAPDHSGEIPSDVTLVVQDPIAYPATTLAHVPATTGVRSLVYDPERRALLLVTNTTPANPIVRYVYENGAWSAPTQSAASSTSFLDAALSADGATIFAITSTSLVPVDPVTLAAGTAVAAPSLADNSALKNIVVGNDNRGLITTSLTTSGTTRGYLYDPESARLLQNNVPLNNATPAMSGNGGGAVLVQGDPSLSTAPAIYVYGTSSNALSPSSVPGVNQNSVPPAIDRAITRIVLNGTRVYDGSLGFLGTLPDTTAAVAIKPDGKRAYAYDTAAGGIHVYDISVDRDEAAYTPLGTATPLAGDPGSGVRMIITPDGQTLFLAGSTQIVVQPTPAL